MHKIFCAVLAFIIGLLANLGICVRPAEKAQSVTAAALEKFSVEGCCEKRVDFARQPVNTVVLQLESAEKALVEIYSGDNLLYSREGTELTRFCAFKTLETDSLTIKITAEKLKIKQAQICLKRGGTDKFRVTSYFVASTIASPGSINPKCFDVITDAILFGCAAFNEKGEINTDTALLEAALANLRSAIGGRRVNVYINLLGPDASGEFGDWYDYIAAKAQLHTAAFKSGALESEIASLADKYGFDGVFFDYEYPVKMKYWREFSSFLVSLNKATDKKIGLALADWDLGLSSSALKAVDVVEMMQYDLFNEQGNHADFDSAVNGVKAARDYLIPDSKIDLGVPFYGRPADRGEFWYNYNQYAAQLGANSDSAVVSGGKTAYFNCWQTVYDKTAYAISCGIGGMMVWHYACDVFDTDNSLSLFGAMGECIADRAAK